jgi:hypothetical protein
MKYLVVLTMNSLHELGCVSLPGQVGDRGNCEFWPSRVPSSTYPHSQLAARSAAIPTYPPSGAEFRALEGGRSDTCLPLRGAYLPHDHTYPRAGFSNCRGHLSHLPENVRQRR